MVLILECTRVQKAKGDMSMEYKYEPHHVAFLDILGFEQMVQGNSEESVYVHDLMSQMDAIAAQQNGNKANSGKRVKVSSFSDSFVISCVGAVEDQYAFSSVLGLAGTIQAHFALRHSVLFRGGVSHGDLYHNGPVVYGPGMIEAYKLEANDAIYPRIIVEPSIIDSWEGGISLDGWDMSVETILNYGDDVLPHINLFYYATLMACVWENILGEEYHQPPWITFAELIARECSGEKPLHIKVKWMWLQNQLDKNQNSMKALWDSKRRQAQT